MAVVPYGVKEGETISGPGVRAADLRPPRTPCMRTRRRQEFGEGSCRSERRCRWRTEKLEELLNLYAKQGWILKTITPHEHTIAHIVFERDKNR